MKATGKSWRCNIEESLLKAVRSLEIGAYHNELAELSHVSDLELTKKWSMRKMIDCSTYQKPFAEDIASKNYKV